MSTWLVMAVAEAVAALVGFVVGRYWDAEKDEQEEEADDR